MIPQGPIQVLLPEGVAAPSHLLSETSSTQSNNHLFGFEAAKPSTEHLQDKEGLGADLSLIQMVRSSLSESKCTMDEPLRCPGMRS